MKIRKQLGDGQRHGEFRRKSVVASCNLTKNHFGQHFIVSHLLIFKSLKTLYFRLCVELNLNHFVFLCSVPMKRPSYTVK
jgi:hypothetical protein